MYREAAPEETARELTFEQLSVEARQRLVDACAGQGAPLLLDTRPALLGSPGRWGAAMVALGLMFLAVALRGHGDISHGPRQISGPELAATAALGGAFQLASLLLARSLLLRGGRPFPSGLYLFARDLVDARGARLRLVPTALLTVARRLRRGVELRTASGEVFAFQLPPDQQEDALAEFRALRAAWLRAEATGDLPTLRRLDPFHAERAAWRDPPPAGPPSRSVAWLRSVAPPLLLAALLGLPGSALLVRYLAEKSDLDGVWKSSANNQPSALAAYLSQRGGTPRARHAADDALFKLAAASPHNDELLRYLELRGEQATRATELLYQRLDALRPFDAWIQPPGSAEADLVPRDQALDFQLHEFTRLGVGPLRDRVDAELLRRALDAPGPLLLERYARVGSERREVLARHLPRRQIDRAILLRKPARLRALLNEGAQVDESLRVEARAALVAMYEAPRVRLASLTKLRTTLAHALDDALSNATFTGAPLVVSVEPWTPSPPYPHDPLVEYADKIRHALIAALRTYAPDELLPVRDGNHQTSAPGPLPPGALHLRVTFRPSQVFPPTDPEQPCDTVVTLAVEGPQQPPLPAQPVTIRSLHPRHHSYRGQPFANAAQIRMVAALLGELPEFRKPRPSGLILTQNN